MSEVAAGHHSQRCGWTPHRPPEPLATIVPHAAPTGRPRRGHKGVTVAKNEKRIQVTLACESCKRRNYITTKNKMNDRERIEMKKFCSWDRRHTLHKETR